MAAEKNLLPFNSLQKEPGCPSANPIFSNLYKKGLESFFALW
jgi:hypothetical protein